MVLVFNSHTILRKNMQQSTQPLSFLSDLSEAEQETISGGYSFSYSAGGSSFFTDSAGKSISFSRSSDNGKSIAFVDGKQVDLATAEAAFNQRKNEFFSILQFPTGFSFNFR
jgi:hypothetical protein